MNLQIPYCYILRVDNLLYFRHCLANLSTLRSYFCDCGCNLGPCMKRRLLLQPCLQAAPYSYCSSRLESREWGGAVLFETHSHCSTAPSASSIHICTSASIEATLTLLT